MARLSHHKVYGVTYRKLNTLEKFSGTLAYDAEKKLFFLRSVTETVVAKGPNLAAIRETFIVNINTTEEAKLATATV